MAKIRLRSDEELRADLADKLKDGKQRLERMRVEWNAARATYQGVTQKGFGGVDADMVATFLATAQQDNADQISLDSMRVLNNMYGLHSKLCISEPAVSCKPFNRDLESIKSSQYAQIAVEHIRQSTTLPSVLEKGVYLNTAVPGTGILFHGWDEEAGRVTTDAEVIKAAVQAEKLEELELTLEGDLWFRSVSPDDFIIDPNATEFDIDADWCMERHRIPLEEAIYRYPEKAAFLELEAEKAKRSRDTQYSQKEADQPRRRASSLNFWEYYERARPWNGMAGAYIIFVESEENQVEILSRNPNPYAHKQLPYSVLTDIDVPDDPYGLSRAVVALPAQEAINQMFMQVIANIELHGNIRLLWPEGATSDDMSSNHPAIRIPYNAALGEKPVYLSPSNVTTDIWRLHTLLGSEIDQLYGSNEFDRGEINRELSSFAVQLAIEQGDKRKIRLFNKKKRLLKRCYEQSISNLVQYASEERMFRVCGKEESHNFEFFKGSDLAGDYGIFVDFGPYMPIDPYARKQQILDIVKQGIFEKAGGNYQKLVTILVDGDMLDIKDLFDQAKRVQEEEFMRMIEGENVPVQEWHEHLTHYAACAEFMQKKFFESLPPESKKAILDHSNEHKQAIAKLEAEAQQQGAPTPIAGAKDAEGAGAPTNAPQEPGNPAQPEPMAIAPLPNAG
jgi:hypothetical protein